MATSVQEMQWTKCLASCELCSLTPEGFETYTNNADSRTLECARTCEDSLPAWDDNTAMTINEKHETDTQTRSIPEMMETCMSHSFPSPPTVETAGMTGSDVSSANDDEDDVWSVVSDTSYGPSLRDDTGEELDEESQADDDNNKDTDEDKTDGEDDLNSRDQEERFGHNADIEKSLTKDTSEHHGNEEDEHFDDCTEEGIRLAEVQKQLEDHKQKTVEHIRRLVMEYHEQLDEIRDHYHRLERECTTSASAAAAANRDECNRMISRVGTLEEKLRICKEEARSLECELESKHCKVVDSLKREHYRQLDQCKSKFKQDCHLLREALTESEDHHRQYAILFAEAADALSGQIKKAEDMKVACERTLETAAEVHDIEVAKLHVNLRWLEDKMKRALAKEAEDHDAHLHTRNQLAKAEYEIEGLKHKEQEMASAKEELERQHEQRLAEVRHSYEQKLELAKQEHEADNALSEEQICDLESEMDEMCQQKDELYHAKDQLCEKMEEAYQDLEITYDHDLSEARDVIERLEQNIRAMSDELKEIKEERTQLEQDIGEAEATIEELCQQAQGNEAEYEQSRSAAASGRQCLESEVRYLRGALKKAKQEDKELRDQLKDAIQGLQESQGRQQELKQREQALMSQCAADRLMFERSAYALRSLLQKN